MTSGLAIGALAERTGVAPSALRFYEANGLIHSERNASGHRRYRADVLRRVGFIRVAQRVGLPLTEIRTALESLPEGRTPNRKDWARLASSLPKDQVSSSKVGAWPPSSVGPWQLAQNSA